MIEVLVAIYGLVALIVGVKVFIRTLNWLGEVDRVSFSHSGLKVWLWGFLAILVALGLEGMILYTVRGATAVALLAVLVGPIEEGAKLLPFFVGGRKEWSLTLKTALVFGFLEAVLYFVVLMAQGNVIGAFLRSIILTFHVAWTALAVEEGMRGNLTWGYLKASVVHSLYDAPVLFLFLSPALAGILAIPGFYILLYLNSSLDDVFGGIINMAKRKPSETESLSPSP